MLAGRFQTGSRGVYPAHSHIHAQIWAWRDCQWSLLYFPSCAKSTVCVIRVGRSARPHEIRKCRRLSQASIGDINSPTTQAAGALLK